jgi:hypothetical protein
MEPETKNPKNPFERLMNGLESLLTMMKEIRALLEAIAAWQLRMRLWSGGVRRRTSHLRRQDRPIRDAGREREPAESPAARRIFNPARIQGQRHRSICRAI